MRLKAFVAAAAIALALPVAGAATTPREDDAPGDAPEVATAYSHPGAPAALQSPLAPCSSGAHSLSHYGARVYPEYGNGGYVSLHTDVHMVYDAATNLFLPGNHVELTDRATQCLTSASTSSARTRTPPART